MKSVSKSTKITILGLFKQALVWILSLVYMPNLIIVYLVVSRQRKSSVGPLMTCVWRHSVLYLAGVKVNYMDEARF